MALITGIHQFCILSGVGLLFTPLLTQKRMEKYGRSKLPFIINLFVLDLVTRSKKNGFFGLS